MLNKFSLIRIVGYFFISAVSIIYPWDLLWTTLGIISAGLGIYLVDKAYSDEYEALRRE